MTVREDDAKPAATPAAEQPATSGTAYLARRRAALAEVEARRHARTRARFEVSGELRTLAVAAAAGRRDGTELLLDESYLVRSDVEAAFLEAADRCGDALAALGLELRVSGPWPAYSFVPAAGKADRG